MVTIHFYIENSDQFLLSRASGKDPEQLDCELEVRPIYLYNPPAIQALPGFRRKATGKVSELPKKTKETSLFMMNWMVQR